MIHGSRSSPARRSVSAIRLAAAIANGFGRVLRQLWACARRTSAPTLPLPLRSRKRANERAPASTRISERLPSAVAAPRRHEGAHIGGRKLGRVALSDGAPPRCSARKCEELADVAPVGFQRLRRHALLGAEIAEPAADFGGDVGAAARCAHGGQEWQRFLHPSLSARNRPDRTATMAARIVDVLVPVALDQTYSYRVPAGSSSRPATW